VWSSTLPGISISPGFAGVHVGTQRSHGAAVSSAKRRSSGEEAAMTTSEVLKELEGFGTAQNRKVYARHGVGDNQYGVSFGNLRALGEKHLGDQGLAEELWATGNNDARVLASIIADPEAMTSKLLESWRKDLDNYVITDAFTGLVARTPHCLKKMEKWTKAKAEWTSRAGFGLLAHLAMRDPVLPDDYFETYLELIEQEIHARKNRTRDAMNSALIAIGIRNQRLQDKAVAAAGRIGKVDVDHGETECTTPDAVEYIKRTIERQSRHEGHDPK
jgi:3-methyladenine DNA glycosylase AlkD